MADMIRGSVSIVEDGVKADVLDLTNNNALAVALLDGAGNQITSIGGTGGTSATDDSAFTAASGTGTPMMGFVTSDTVDAGDVGVIGMLANRQVKVTLYDSAGSEISTFGGGTEEQLDYDTGAGVVSLSVIGLALPGSGGPVAGGTTSNPINIRVVDGDSSVLADVLDLTNSNPIAVAIVDASGDQIASFGGGVQYTEGDVDSTITGVAIMWEDSGNVLKSVSAGTPLPVGDGGGSLTVDNAGTFAVQAAQSGTWNVTNISGTVSLPTGAATAANQTTIIGHVDGIEGLLTTIDADTSALAAAVSGTEVQVDVLTMPVVTVTGTVTANLAAGTNAIGKLAANSGVDIGDVDVTSVSGNVTVIQGTATNLKAQAEAYQGGSAVGAANPLEVTLANGSVPSHAVTNAGTFAVQATVAAGAATIAKAEDAVAGSGDTGVFSLSVANEAQSTLAADGDYIARAADTKGNTLVAGTTAHDGVDSGNPVKIGMKAANALPTAVANADRVNAIGDLFGRQLVAHIDPAMQVWKAVNYTAQQTGATIWDPTAGKKIAVTAVSIGSYGTTAGRLILWFGDNADTTYTAGTDQVLFAGSFAPSASSKPGAVLPLATPVFCTTADRELHITTDAAMSVDVTVYGYEW